MEDVWATNNTTVENTSNALATARLDRALLVEMEESQHDPTDITLSRDNSMELEVENFIVNAGWFNFM